MRIFMGIVCAIRLVVSALRSLLGKPHDEPMTQAELDAALEAASKGVPDATDWRNSIVDLLKILRLDSGFEAREALWKECGNQSLYGGSATQNIELHKIVKRKVAEHLIIV